MAYIDELNRKHANTEAEDRQLMAMECYARTTGKQTSKLIGGKWFSVFTREGDRNTIVYRWEGGYPTQYISREAAVSVLARA